MSAAAATVPLDGAGATSSLTTTYGRSATDVSHDDDTEGWSDDQEDVDEVKKEEIQKFLTCGEVSKNLND